MQLQTVLPFEPPERIFARVFHEYRPRTAIAAVDLRFKRYANANSGISWREARLVVKLSDLWQGAPANVLEALAHILISRMFRRETPAAAMALYKRFLNRKEVRHSMQVIKQVRGRKYVSGPQGDVYDLAEIFEELNSTYFGGLVPQPELGWSRTRSRTLLGHYDVAHHAIILSKLLDSARVERLVVAYVLYHEMLHLKHPIEHGPTQRRIHTSAFHAEERLFDGYQAAKEALKRICAAAARQR
jgi:hypothetical protein